MNRNAVVANANAVALIVLLGVVIIQAYRILSDQETLETMSMTLEASRATTRHLSAQLINADASTLEPTPPKGIIWGTSIQHNVVYGNTIEPSMHREPDGTIVMQMTIPEGMVIHGTWTSDGQENWRQLAPKESQDQPVPIGTIDIQHGPVDDTRHIAFYNMHFSGQDAWTHRAPEGHMVVHGGGPWSEHCQRFHEAPVVVRPWYERHPWVAPVVAAIQGWRQGPETRAAYHGALAGFGHVTP